MSTKIITYQGGMLHILRKPDGFAEETVRTARLAAADRIEELERQLSRMTDAYTNMRAWAEENGVDTVARNTPQSSAAGERGQ